MTGNKEIFTIERKFLDFFIAAYLPEICISFDKCKLNSKFAF